MSNARYKLHWVTAVIEVLKTLKEMIIPLLVLVFANGFKDTGSGKWYFEYLTFIIFGVLILTFFISGIIKWKRFVYWFEEDELRIEYGLFVKKKRYIPFDRIQSLDYTEGILHRPLKLVKVKVETAGNTASLKSEAELTAITKEDAKRIETVIAEAKKRRITVPIEENEEMDMMVEVEVPRSKSVFTMSIKDLLILATTSGGIGLILSGAFIFIMQFGDLLPYETVYDEFARFVKFGVFIVVIAALFGLIIVWGISVAMTFLSYYGFKVSLEEEDLVITKGLIEKKRATVPLNRIQGIRIIENPFRQFFGYATVVIDNAGGGLGEDARITLLPLVKREKVIEPLKEIFPDFLFEDPVNKLPSKGKRYYYRIYFIWMVPLFGAVSYFFFPYGLLSFLVLPLVVLLGLWQHRSAAYTLTNQQLTMRFRQFSLQTVYVMKKRIQSMEMKQNYFHKKKGVATLSARIKSGASMFNAQVSHMEESEAERILGWYEPSGENETKK
ncbi:PH domain-containing protein [Sporosarcina sp. CAU 1771]